MSAFQPKQATLRHHLKLHEPHTMYSDEENMSVSDDGANEESFAAEVSDANEDLELKDADYLSLYNEDEENMSVSDDAESEEDNDANEDLELIETDSSSSLRAEENMSVSDNAASDEPSSEEGSDWELDVNAENADGDLKEKANKDLNFAKGACELHIEELICYDSNLKYLDLADKRSVGLKKFKQKVISEYFRLKCPALMQVKIDSLNALDLENKIFNFHALYDTLLEEQISKKMQDNVSEFYFTYQQLFLQSLNNFDRNTKRRRIVRFINLKRLLNRYIVDTNNHFTNRKTYLELMFHLRKEFEDDSKLIVDVFHNLLTFDSKLFLDETTRDLEFLIGHALKEKYNFSLLYEDYEDQTCHDYSFNPLSTCLSQQYCDNTKTLLKYGFPYVFQRSAFQSICKQVFDDSFKMNEEDEDLEDPGLLVDETATPLLMLSPANLRSQMILQVFLPFLQRFIPGSGFIDTFTMWSRSIPDPYVTPQEMYDRMKDYVQPWFMDVLQDICNTYKETQVYDDDHTVMAPRKLSHLCRCVVRKQLKKNYLLPKGIRKLGMPKIIRRYLRLKS